MEIDYQNIVESWTDLLEHEDLPKIKDNHRKAVTAVLLENQKKEMRARRAILNENEQGTNAGAVQNWDPVLISLVRRSAPNLIAHDIAGVQAMVGPTQLIFAMRSNYVLRDGAGAVTTKPEALFNEAAQWGAKHGSGATRNAALPTEGNSSSLPTAGEVVNTVEPVGAEDPEIGDVLYDGDPLTPLFNTADAERLGTAGGEAFSEMGFTIDKVTVTAQSQALKATYTVEMAQDLRSIHGLEAETELANILTTEMLAEQNRRIIRLVNRKAMLGCQQAGIAKSGIFDLWADADGRWSAERYKNLVVQLDREANAIAKATRRGKGNFVIVSSDVASMLAASGMLDYTPAMSTDLNVDDTGNTFAGLINGRIKVYVDPYATLNYVTVGYRGTNPYDAGLFYCPYIPLTMYKTVGEDDFQPRIGFKTRAGFVTNPFNLPAGSVNNAASQEGVDRGNTYFRIFRVDNLIGTPTP